MPDSTSCDKSATINSLAATVFGRTLNSDRNIMISGPGGNSLQDMTLVPSYPIFHRECADTTNNTFSGAGVLSGIICSSESAPDRVVAVSAGGGSSRQILPLCKAASSRCCRFTSTINATHYRSDSQCGCCVTLYWPVPVNCHPPIQPVPAHPESW